MPGARAALTKDDWVTAGLRALSTGGPDAVAIEPLAAALGATKGSGYWHWGSRAALLDAVLAAWREVATRSVVADVEAAGGDPRERLVRLLVTVTSAIEAAPGHLATLTHPDPAVRDVVRQVTADRIAYLARLLAETGLASAEADRRAVLAYAGYLGIAQLTVTVPAALPDTAEQRRALLRTVVDVVLAT